MDVPYIMGLSALTGSIIGGLISGIAKWVSVRSQARANRLADDIARRKELFQDFIAAASKTYGSALTNNEPQVGELVQLYALISRMRIVCSPELVVCADGVLCLILDTYFAPNRTIRELHELIKSGSGLDPLKEIADLARHELQRLAVV